MLALVVAPGLVAALVLGMEVAPAPAVALVQVVALAPAAVADLPGALGGVALAHAVAAEPTAAHKLVVAPLSVVVSVGWDGVGVRVGAVVAWCCMSLAQSPPWPLIPSPSPF